MPNLRPCYCTECVNGTLVYLSLDIALPGTDIDDTIRNSRAGKYRPFCGVVPDFCTGRCIERVDIFIIGTGIDDSVCDCRA